MQTFFRITSLYDLVEFSELSMVTNASNSLKYFSWLDMMKWTWDLGMKKTCILLDIIYIVFFLKDCYWWLVVTLAENNIQKKTAIKKMCKKDDRLSHENNMKVLYFYCNQSSRFIFVHLILLKRVKRFITEYILDIRTII